MLNEQGPFTPKPRLPIIDELVTTVLSQNTSDVNRDRAFAALKARWPEWEQVSDAPVRSIADTIRPGGLADTKAPRIKAILTTIQEREGRLDLTRLHELDDDEVVEYLCSLPGVGPKTAACVLVFAMGRSAFPVDTHVLRVVGRLGLVEPRVGAETVQRALTPQIPSELRYELHTQLIAHGRTVCSARRPHCSRCVLFDLCPSGAELLAAGAAR